MFVNLFGDTHYLACSKLKGHVEHEVIEQAILGKKRASGGPLRVIVKVDRWSPNRHWSMDSCHPGR